MDTPNFIPKPGQVDFTHIRWCPVVNIVVFREDKLLLVKRSKQLRSHPQVWSGVSGFIDDDKSLNEKVIQELTEELGLQATQIQTIKLCGVFDQNEPESGKTWIVHAVRAVIAADVQIELDWEAEAYEWTTYPLPKQYELLPGFETVLALTCEQPNAVTT